jgi:HK97 family phage portal protein
MNLFNTIRKFFSASEQSPMPGPLDDFWYEDVGVSSLSEVGKKITVDRALRLSVVMACVRVLSETVASLPLHVYRRTADGREKVTDHPLYEVLHRKPNGQQTAFEWLEFGMNCLCLEGNFVSLIRGGPRGGVDSLIPVPPSAVSFDVRPNGRISYLVRLGDGTQRPYSEDQVLHIRGMSLDGKIGLNPIRYAKETIGLTVAAEEHGAKFFRTGGRATSHLKCVGKVQKEVKEAYARRIAEMNAAGCVVTDEGMEWSALPVTNEDMQFLETRKFQLADIARLYRVPLHLIQEHEKSTSWGTGIESFNRQFVTHTIRPWLVRWEQRINSDIFGDGSEYYAEFNVDGLLRGDTLPRYQAHEIGIRSHFLTPNEVRGIEGLNPVDGGDEFPPIAGAAPLGRGANTQDQNKGENNADD